MNTREAEESYYREAKAHPVLIFGLYGICAGVAWNLPISLYWRIAAYLAMNFWRCSGSDFVRDDNRAHPIERRLSARS